MTVDRLADRVVDALSATYALEDSGQVRDRVRGIVERAATQGAVTVDGQIEQLLDLWLDGLAARKPALPKPDAAIADLADWLGVKEGELTQLRRWAGLILDHYKPIVSGLAIVATALYGIAFTRFYDALDTSPEAVGISATQMLARSAVGGFVFLAIGSIVVLAPIAPFIPAISGSLQSKPRSNGRIVDVIAIGLLSTLIQFWFLGELDVPVESRLLIAPLPALAAIVASIRDIRLWPFRVEVRPLRFRYVDFGLAAFATALIGLGIFTAKTTHIAEDLGEEARAGEKVSSPKIFGLPVLGIRADPALIDWQGSAPATPHLPRCVLYLGQSDGSTVVYDPTLFRTIQVATEDVTLTMQSNTTNCSAPVNRKAPFIRRRPGYLECRPGAWQRRPRPHFGFSWSQDGYAVETAVEDRFRLGPGNLGHSIRCAVLAANVLGEGVAFSRPFIPRSLPGRPARRGSR